MKDDLGPAPQEIPKKRRALEQSPDLWLAMWLARDDLTPSERRRLAEEKQRRKDNNQPVSIGFTGTREGLTPEQRKEIMALVKRLCPKKLLDAGVVEAHHGDCIGGDAQFHKICQDLAVPVVLHPPENPKLRAYCRGAVRTERSKPYLERNRDIVRVATLMIGAPKEPREPAPGRGQGTWSTIRYARTRADAALTVIWPDGTNGG